ncbi:hypothetical protein [Luteolibacter marinus]|uniref:hypothetical protein n=1 Tax=Luteolibacter marinus TaxID=2776705 RepID=UPI0018689739|nr:hypothetical protein [Luteolibacter marinus]
MKALPLLPRITFSALLAVLAWTGHAGATGEDDFDNNHKSNDKWGADIKWGNGVLTETNQRAEYTCANATTFDQLNWPWQAARLPYNADWEVQVEVYNMTAPTESFQESSLGISIDSPLSAGDFFYNELYKSVFLANPADSGFHGSLYKNDSNVDFTDTSNLPTSMGAVRITWNAATKVATLYYDTNPGDGYQWTEYGSFGLAGSGGATANTNWGMGDSDQFFMSIYGYSSLMLASGGQMYLDNFSETGGVASNGGQRPDPTGNFEFPFPVGNDLLTRISSLTGNYQGVSPVIPNRSYNFDVAQDESGKVMGMGTVSGVEDQNGNSDLDLSLGKVKTSNDEPVAEIKNNFKGTADGMDATFKSKGVFPLELVEVGSVPLLAGGVALPMGVTGSASYNGKVAGVPFKGKNEPLEFESPPGASDNLKQDWTLQLDIARKEIKGKERTVASAVLTLPTGEVVEFPEKPVKYSQTKGYKISFKKGTNTTVVPNAIDKKTSVVLTGLNFEQQGDDWIPNAGTISYRFLGQRGVADLTEFLAP